MPEIEVSIVYALPEQQDVRKVSVAMGTSALDAIRASHMLDDYPSIDLNRMKVGVFANLLDGRSRPSPDKYQVRQGDRLEIYRPLLIDPKEARLQRAKKRS